MLINDTPTSSPFLFPEMSMSWVCHFNVVTPWCNINGKGNLMLHHLARQNLVNYNCNPLEDGYK